MDELERMSVEIYNKHTQKQPIFTVDKWKLHKRNTSSYIVTRLSVMQPLDC